jgi:hypothetical protein
MPSQSPALSNVEYAQAINSSKKIIKLIEGRDKYITNHGLDPAINNPMATWSPEQNHLTFYKPILSENRININFLRIFTMVFTGSFLGLKDAQGMDILQEVPKNIDKYVNALIKKAGSKNRIWWFKRYLKLVDTFPELKKYIYRRLLENRASYMGKLLLTTICMCILKGWLSYLRVVLLKS